MIGQIGGLKIVGKFLTKRLFFVLLLSLVALSGGCSNIPTVANQSDNTSKVYQSDTSIEDIEIKLEIGDTEERENWTQTFIYPSNIDDTFVIDVCLPDDYDENITYPVVYLTDCYWRRDDYGSIKELYQSGKTKEFIIIGIGYPEDYNFDVIRQRDLLFEPDKFLSMIVKGVIPYVESNYKIDAKDRTFCGASYGGYFMVYSLFQSDGLTEGIFKNYILASPTFWEVTDGIPLEEFEENYFDRTNILNANVYLTVGEDEDEAEFLRPIDEFVEEVEGRDYQGLNLTYKVYEDKHHYNVWMPSLLDGLEMYLAK